jgi:hypothetical protein
MSGKFQVWAYGMQGNDDMCDGEYDTLEEALDVVRREWPYPMKLLLPNGDSYDFSKLEEFRQPVIYKYMVLREVENKQAHQNLLLKDIQNDPDLRFFLKLLRHPRSYDAIINSCEGHKVPEQRAKQMEALLKLIHCDLIEFIDFCDGSGLQDVKKRWR